MARFESPVSLTPWAQMAIIWDSRTGSGETKVHGHTDDGKTYDSMFIGFLVYAIDRARALKKSHAHDPKLIRYGFSAVGSDWRGLVSVWQLIGDGKRRHVCKGLGYPQAASCAIQVLNGRCMYHWLLWQVVADRNCMCVCAEINAL
jgi:hypothetical protein